MNSPPDIPETGFVDPKWVKKRYCISNSTMYAWIARNRLPRPYRIGERAVRFCVEDIRAFEAKFLARLEPAASGIEKLGSLSLEAGGSRDR